MSNIIEFLNIINQENPDLSFDGLWKEHPAKTHCFCLVNSEASAHDAKNKLLEQYGITVEVRPGAGNRDKRFLVIKQDDHLTMCAERELSKVRYSRLPEPLAGYLAYLNSSMGASFVTEWRAVRRPGERLAAECEILTTDALLRTRLFVYFIRRPDLALAVSARREVTETGTQSYATIPFIEDPRLLPVIKQTIDEFKSSEQAVTSAGLNGMDTMLIALNCLEIFSVERISIAKQDLALTYLFHAYAGVAKTDLDQARLYCDLFNKVKDTDEAEISRVFEPFILDLAQRIASIEQARTRAHTHSPRFVFAGEDTASASVDAEEMRSASDDSIARL